MSAIIADDNTITDPPTKKTFTDYLKKTNSENFIIAPTTPEEISDLIHNLNKSSESVGLIVFPLKS